MKRIIFGLVCILSFSSAASALDASDFNPIRKDIAELKVSVAKLEVKVDTLADKVDKLADKVSEVSKEKVVVEKVATPVEKYVVKSEPKAPDCPVNCSVCKDGTCQVVNGHCVCPQQSAPVVNQKVIVGYRTERVCNGTSCSMVQVPVYGDVTQPVPVYVQPGVYTQVQQASYVQPYPFPAQTQYLYQDGSVSQNWSSGGCSSGSCGSSQYYSSGGCSSGSGGCGLMSGNGPIRRVVRGLFGGCGG